MYRKHKSLPVLLLVLACVGLLLPRRGGTVWMTLVQLNYDSLRSQKSESQQQHNDDYGPAYDSNIPSFDNAQTVKCTKCLLQCLVAMI
jgi:hypothetical protein